MNTNATLSLAPKLAQAVLDDDWKAAVILAADLKAALAEPQPVAPWTPHNQRNSIIAHSPGCAL